MYLIEVNPRASRTVPFMSKVTGVPMVELAVRISLGKTLAELGWAGGLRPVPPFTAVKAPAFSTAKLKGVDPSVGPFMQSTGEVIGISLDHRVAMAKALTGASLIPPRAGEDEVPLALLSIADRDKGGLVDVARALVRGRLPARGHRRHPRGAGAGGLRGRPRRQAGRGARGRRGRDPGPDRRAAGCAWWSTRPRPRSGAVRDAAEIRHATIAEGILCLTSIETGVAAAEALDPDVVDGIAEVRPITDWVPFEVAAAGP